MTTLASPTLGQSTLALWRVEMDADQAGPEHIFDSEQIWTVLRGGASVDLDGECYPVAAGDTIVFPPSAMRRIRASESGLEALVAARGDAKAMLADGTSRGVPPWIA
jgi:quercetin dioxygenase-like cupin family protein